MNAFDLMAVLRLDSSQYDQGLKDAGDEASSLGSKLGGALKTVGKVSAGAMAAGGAAVTALTKQAVDAYSEYEQLKGGVETLFGVQGMTLEEYAESYGKNLKATVDDVVNAIDWSKYPHMNPEGVYQDLNEFVKEWGTDAEALVADAEWFVDEFGMSMEDAEKVVDSFVNSATPEKIEATYNGMLEAQDLVMKNASKAFETAGMSANEYMETVTGFAAALIQSTGQGPQEDIEALKENLDGQYKITKQNLQDRYDARKKYWDDLIKQTKDSKEKDILKEQRDADLKDLKRNNEAQLEEKKKLNEQWIAEAEARNSESNKSAESIERAAKLADQAIIDMADNANKMGSTIESIQSAYAGFSKQNYTMLDNLKLGYGGTKEEMERLLADAERLSGQKFDISSYADIVEAIHVVQTEMGITGTTAKEASETIQGSLSMTKSAWTNLIAGLGSDDANLDELIDNFVGSLEKLGENIFPVVEKALNGISKLIERLLPKLGNKLPGLLKKILPPLLNAVVGLIKSLAQNLPQIIQTIVPPLVQALIEVAGAIIQNLPQILASIFEALMVLLFELFGSLGESLAEPVMALIDGLVGFFSDAWDAIVDIFSGIGEWFAGIWQNIKDVFAGVGEFFSGIFSGAWDAITGVFGGIKKWFGDRWTDIQNVFRNIGTWFGKVFEGVRTVISNIWHGVTEIVKAPVNFLIKGLNAFIGMLNHIQIPDWVPGVGGYGINLPYIPELEQGGILKKGQLGLLEGNGAEAVVPLDQNKKWVSSIVAEMRKQGGGIQGDIIIPVSIGTKRLETIVIEANRLNNYRSGGRA